MREGVKRARVEKRAREGKTEREGMKRVSGEKKTVKISERENSSSKQGVGRA